MSYLLLQHFPKEYRASIKLFSKIEDIELYMDSKISSNSNNAFDFYANKSHLQRRLTEMPEYKCVESFIFNDDSKGLIYNIDIKEDCLFHIKFDIDTCGSYAPWITKCMVLYDGEFLDSDNIFNTNGDEDDKDYIVLIKVQQKI